MKYALVKFKVHLLGYKTFLILNRSWFIAHYDAGASSLSEMARWRSLFAEYNYEVKYKPKKEGFG